MIQASGLCFDIDHEELLTFHEAAKYVTRKFPGRRGGRALNLSTIYRWVSRGVGGVCLESVRVGGGSQFTSVEALHRFFSRLSDGGAAPKSTGAPSPRLRQTKGGKERHRRIDAAEKVLKKAGI